MIITRHISTQQSRQLRSRAIPFTRPAEIFALASYRKSTRHNGRTQASSTLRVSRHGSRHLFIESGNCKSFEVGREKSTADNTFSDEDSTPRNVFKDGSGSLSADAAVEEINSESTVNFKMEKVVRIFEDIGVPEDGQWDFVAVHGYRFCPQHKEVEYLLEYADKWMRPSDFGFEEAEVELEAMLQEYESRHNKNNVSIHLSQTNCRDGLWSQVDTPIQSGVSDGEAVYLLH